MFHGNLDCLWRNVSAYGMRIAWMRPEIAREAFQIRGHGSELGIRARGRSSARSDGFDRAKKHDHDAKNNPRIGFLRHQYITKYG